MDLGNLLELACEMDWFASGPVPQALVDEVGRAEIDGVLALLPQGSSAMEVAASMAKDIRNYLHPARCLRCAIDMNEQMLEAGAAFATIALLSFIERRQGGLDTEMAKNMWASLKRFMDIVEQNSASS